jgi:hypothetical protein
VLAIALLGWKAWRVLRAGRHSSPGAGR